MSAKQKNQHIKVFARVRPRNSQEMRSQIVVECTSNKDIAVKDKGQTKNFSFDRVFGPESKQVDVYKAVVAPMINEVLQGYNCTVFAYGQTGTGKTFTMVGDRSADFDKQGWQSDPLSGIVPRTLDHLFDELKVRAEDYTVRISFLELYNEELCDLLASPDNDDSKTLRLFEDSMKKGSVIVSGLEERTVYEKNDVYPILEAGSLRRQTAPTLMNASSSRSHTIFTITVHVKVTTPEGEDLFKTGKLNLVDLAGSENIGRSGAVDMRAREAGNINQSLLTLGRVITCLVERAPHVPYRESKLTRILQDSLGGRTKTSIIATVSPALCNLEETLSTFDYAHRARNITNKPEINQKMSKQVLLKNYTDEIERLRRDLMAAREKHGVYLQHEDYNGLMNQIENLSKDLVNKIQLLKVREEELAKQEEIMQSLNMNLFEVKTDLAKNQEILQVKEAALLERERALQELNRQAELLLKTADEATEDSKKLHDRLDRARMVHSHNEELVDRFKNRFLTSLHNMKQTTQTFQARSAELTQALMDLYMAQTSGCHEHLQAVEGHIQPFIDGFDSLLPDLSQRMTYQMELTSQGLELATKDIDEISRGLEDLSSIVVSNMSEQAKVRDPEWQQLFCRLEEVKEVIHKIGNTVEQARGNAKCVGEDLDRLGGLLAKEKEEEEELEKLKLKQEEVFNSLKANRLQQEALMKEEGNLLLEMEKMRKSSAEAEMQIKKRRDQTVATVFEDSQKQLKDLQPLLSILTSLQQELQTNTETSIIPSVNNAKKAETVQAEQIQSEFLQHLAARQRECKEIAEYERKEIAALNEVLARGKLAQQNASSLLNSLKDSFRSLTAAEGRRLQVSGSSTLTACRKFASEISDFCEETFASIHDRCTELKVHFREEYRRDEKTGTTPQRKDFYYPKRLVTSGSFSADQENVPPPSSCNSDSSI